MKKKKVKIYDLKKIKDKKNISEKYFKVKIWPSLQTNGHYGISADISVFSGVYRNIRNVTLKNWGKLFSTKAIIIYSTIFFLLIEKFLSLRNIQTLRYSNYKLLKRVKISKRNLYPTEYSELNSIKCYIECWMECRIGSCL